MAEQMQIDEGIEKFLEDKIPPDKLEEALQWVGRFPSPNGKIVIASFLVCAQEAERFKCALEVLEEYWKSDFQFQHPEARGNPDALPKVRKILGIMYQGAGIPFPKAQGQKTASELTEEVRIKTQNSTYHVYPQPEEGLRKLVREEDGLELFGMLVFVEVGDSMMFNIETGKWKGETWTTSRVESITPILLTVTPT